MANNKLVVILLVLGVVAFSSAKSVNDDASSDESSSNEVISNSKDSRNNSENNVIKTEEGGEIQLSPKDQLLYFTLVAFRDISEHYVDHAANISEQLLNDEALKSPDSVVLSEFRKNITEFMDKYKKYEGLDELFNLVDLYSNTTSHYFDLPGKSAIPDMFTIESKLKKYGSDDLDKEFEKQFMAFVERFYMEFDEFKSKLTKADLEKEKDMIEWLEHFKPIQDTEEKIMSFEKFFHFYD